jgi:hypothetical protein
MGGSIGGGGAHPQLPPPPKPKSPPKWEKQRVGKVMKTVKITMKFIFFVALKIVMLNFLLYLSHSFHQQPTFFAPFKPVAQSPPGILWATATLASSFAFPPSSSPLLHF